MRPHRRLGLLAASSVAVLSAMLTGGCYQGFNGTVNNQGPSGNGTEFTVPADDGPIWVRNANIVVSPDGKRAAMSFTAVNNADVSDALVSITTDPRAKSSQTAAIEIAPKAAVKVGGPEGQPIELSGWSVPAGNYAKVVFTFRVAGVSTPQEVLVVPAIGYYASYAPSKAPEAKQKESTGSQTEKKSESDKSDTKKAQAKDTQATDTQATE